MNPEIKAKWIEALRSGDYQQGGGRLRGGNDQFCCLGVLCDIAANSEGVDVRVTQVELDQPCDCEMCEKGPDYLYNGCDGYLPIEVVNWSGLGYVNPEVTVGGDRRTLSYLNDGGYTFGQIAELIEEQL